MHALESGRAQHGDIVKMCLEEIGLERQPLRWGRECSGEEDHEEQICWGPMFVVCLEATSCTSPLSAGQRARTW